MDARLERPEVAGPDDLNALARKRGWPVLCDTACRFIRRDFDDLVALWRAKAGPAGVPGRGAMTARLLKPYIADLVFHERIAGPGGTRRYRVRLMGGEVTHVAGPASGKFYEEFLPAGSVPLWNALTDAALGHGKPMRIVLRLDEVGKSYLVGEFFAAPLLADDGTASIALTIGHFDATLRWEDVFAAWNNSRAEPVAVS